MYTYATHQPATSLQPGRDSERSERGHLSSITAFCAPTARLAVQQRVSYHPGLVSGGGFKQLPSVGYSRFPAPPTLQSDILVHGHINYNSFVDETVTL
ncbi:hypothetical protein EVAR_13826_1 [Eumeta japonica]|uniref:Uncharacterized protein n=1 Tax=Eumeta variegata TaxID=151549 RepID=A0A4C1U1J0_EUMVA|nr:hypothetical protein EVAR_13826_1 [Eumeta japonica]